MWVYLETAAVSDGAGTAPSVTGWKKSPGNGAMPIFRAMASKGLRTWGETEMPLWFGRHYWIDMEGRISYTPACQKYIPLRPA